MTRCGTCPDHATKAKPETEMSSAHASCPSFVQARLESTSHASRAVPLMIVKPCRISDPLGFDKQNPNHLRSRATSCWHCSLDNIALPTNHESSLKNSHSWDYQTARSHNNTSFTTHVSLPTHICTLGRSSVLPFHVIATMVLV